MSKQPIDKLRVTGKYAGLIAVTILICLGFQKSTSFPYDLKKPVTTMILPDTLREISGLTMLDEKEFACVQDENGILFIYHSVKNEITKQYRFAIDGDYEGIARVGQDMYVLRSDGVIFEILNYQYSSFKLNTYKTGIPCGNSEGLCYDASNKRLLIGCKSRIGKGEEYKDRRAIYAFDLGTKKLGKDPAYEYDVQQVKDQALTMGVDLPRKQKKGGSETILRFAISAICIHPSTGELYMLSALDHMLFIAGKDGKLSNIIRLDPKVFNKAEGITFYPNADMLITNEGQNKKPTLLKFKYTK